MSTIQNDDDLIIIEDDNSSIESEDSLINLDLSESEELISFDDKEENKDDSILGNDINFDFWEEKTKEPKLEETLNISETNDKVEIQDDSSSLFDFSLSEETNNENLITKEEKLEVSDFLTNDIESDNIEELVVVVEENNNNFDLSEVNTETSTLEIEPLNSKDDLIENKDETLELEVLEINNTTEVKNESMDSILEWTILKLKSKKEKSINEIEKKEDNIKDIEIEIKKLQLEKSEVTTETKNLISENKKIDINIESLEKMKTTNIELTKTPTQRKRNIKTTKESDKKIIA